MSEKIADLPTAEELLLRFRIEAIRDEDDWRVLVLSSGHEIHVGGGWVVVHPGKSN